MNLSLPSFRLDNRRALVIGASRGIGLAIAQAFSQMGAQVTLCGRSRPALEDEVAKLVAAGFKADVMVADVTDIEAFAQKIQDAPTFDILVNNAGTNRPKPLAETTVEDFDTVMNLNIRAIVFATKAVTGRMMEAKSGGSIINISSQMGHVGARDRVAYCTSKWAMEGFTKALGVELAPHGIRVNAICPTFIETTLTKPYFENKDFLDEVISKIPLGTLGQVEDIVGAAVFLASDAARLITGSSVMVDGGWTAQ